MEKSTVSQKLPVHFADSPPLNDVHPFDARLIEAMQILQKINVCLDAIDEAIDRLSTSDTGAGKPAKNCASPAGN